MSVSTQTDARFNLLRSPDLALNVTEASKSFAAHNGDGRWARLISRARGEAPKPAPAKRIVAVDRVTFQVNRNEIFGILGANGSGKSTLIRLISTLLIPDTGSVTVFGYDVVSDEMAVKRLINRVSVDAAFFKKLSPMENLLYGARLYGMEAGPAAKRIVEILQRLGIENKNIYAPLEEDAVSESRAAVRLTMPARI